MSKVSGILSFDDLKQVTGYQRRSDIERTLKEQGIRVFMGRNGPWTTTDLINQAGGYTPPSQDSYSPEII
ncbi:DUF4224 domain-containing protein [Pseudomonas helleri]|uniref:DUF4224 domain-containing protein n=1 Tax=Pseudomonas helleri TaxID=1608996 RepID=UPI001296E6DC|nr:DUF4224 domain-containing protein [Pseudomonas helleri]MQT34848.1 DUF4224 domain-containing protein [Pseudomonas helleri]